MPPQSAFRCNNALYSVYIQFLFIVFPCFSYLSHPFVVVYNNTCVDACSKRCWYCSYIWEKKRTASGRGGVIIRKSCCWINTTSVVIVKRRGIGNHHKKKKREGRGLFCKTTNRRSVLCVIVLLRLHIFNQLRWRFCIRLRCIATSIYLFSILSVQYVECEYSK